MCTGICLLAFLVTAVVGAPSFRSMSILEQRSDIPIGFAKSSPAPPTNVLNLRLALKQSDMPGLEKALYDVSTPGSSLYGQHLTKEEVEVFVAPSPESVSLVQQWLAANDITAKTISPAGDWLQFSIPVSQANTLLQADFTVFNHAETGTQLTRTLAYSIPVELQGHVDLIHPTITFDDPFAGLPVMRSPTPLDQANPAGTELNAGAAPASCNNLITPSCLQELYNIPTAPATQSTNQLAVSGFISEFANQADMAAFLTEFRPDVSNATTFTLQTLDNGLNPQLPSEAGTEANLDTQYTVGVATGVPVTFISVGNSFDDGSLHGFLDIINFLLSETNPPQVLTTSYGQNENTISSALAIQLCNAYAQLGARGTSILFASGDGGVAGLHTTACSTSFLPTFPSGCPFLTSVGATTGTNETAATFSSGGFSNFFAQPSYQAGAVSKFLNTIGTLNAGKFNVTGRAFPDVSAQGEKVQIVVGGKTGSVAGTSCSSPIFASVVSLLNDRLMAAGKPPLGFLNPLLYSPAALPALNDVTTGNNPGCGTNGFPATVGWDAITGLGTPNFELLLRTVGL